MSIKPSATSLVRLLFHFALLVFSVEIVIRHWMMNQVPTQVSELFVLGLLAINALVLVQFFRSGVRLEAKTKKGRS